jgi:hypothetical protein
MSSVMTKQYIQETGFDHPLDRRWLLSAGGAAFMAALLRPVAGARATDTRMIMFRRVGCPWCLAFDREIGPIYPKTDLAKRAPLSSLDLDKDPMPDAKLDRVVRFTPTFVLISEGREVGRIEGYPGADFFWGLAEAMIAKLPAGG